MALLLALERDAGLRDRESGRSRRCSRPSLRLPRPSPKAETRAELWPGDTGRRRVFYRVRKERGADAAYVRVVMLPQSPFFWPLRKVTGGAVWMLSPYYRNGGMEICLVESHAAAVKHTVITIEKAIGRIKRYLQLTTVMAAKQRANVHAVPRMSARVALGRPPSCHANVAANR
jgi:hypothetical protein